jgi:hypothetical protein
VEIGSWADWVNTLGTYLAVAGAAFAGVVGLRSYRSQHAATERQLAGQAADERRRVERERQEQARKVAVWIYRGRFNWSVDSANTSGLPVFRLVLRVYCDDPAFSVAIERGTHGPQDGGRSTKLSNALETVLDERGALDANPALVHVDITFTDAAGTRWLRTEDGRLRVVEDAFEFPDVDQRLVDRLVPMRPLEQRRRGIDER